MIVASRFAAASSSAYVGCQDVPAIALLSG
jgi:hypothetical protein